MGYSVANGERHFGHAKWRHFREGRGNCGIFQGVLRDIERHTEGAILVTENGVASGEERGIVGYNEVFCGI